MSKKTSFANTPWYVLKSGNQPIYPMINLAEPHTPCECIYGFSDKAIYDVFIKGAGEPLTPYPLVKGYLSHQLDAAGSAETKRDRLRLVILDATDQAQPVLLATTMASVLLAQQEKTEQVSIEYELVFDPETNGYRFRDDSKGVSPPDPLSIVV